MSTRRDRPVELLIAGAGPVGLFAALVARRRGLDTLLLDQTSRGSGRGHATLLHSASLGLLAEAGVLDRVRTEGRTLTSVGLTVDGARRVALELPSPALAVTQTRMEEALLAALRASGGSVDAPLQATMLLEDAGGVSVRVVRREYVTLGAPANYSEWQPVESSLVHADYVLGTDGYDSNVRKALGVPLTEAGPTESFAMFEGPVRDDPGQSIELGFTDGLVCSMVPLAGMRARFAFQLDSGLDREPDLSRFTRLVEERAPFFRGPLERVDWSSVMHFERRLARSFGAGRVWLAGDAAHVTSPIGAQSVNLGLLEANGFVDRIAACRDGRSGLEGLLHYGQSQQRDWHKLLGFNVKFSLAPHAPAWLGPLARKIPAVLPASGEALKAMLAQLGLRTD